MEAVDANVILRYLVGDNPEQETAARTLMDGLTPSNPGFICREVVIEVAWVLERSYRFTRSRVAEALMDLTASDRPSWWRIRMTWPLPRTATAMEALACSDLMILSAAEREGAIPLHTFDRRLARMEGAVLVGHWTAGE